MVLLAFTYVGECAGLGTAACWSLCSLAFTAAGRRIGAFAVNQLRIPLAVVLLALTHAILFGSLWPANLEARQLALLAVSGVVGLALGDLFLFRCFVLIGPRLGTLLMTTAPVMAAVLAWPLLGERLGAGAIGGMALTLLGVAWVLSRRPTFGTQQPGPRERGAGMIMGLLGAAGQAAGLICAKLGMSASAGPAVADESAVGAGAVDPLSATLVRMVAGAVGIWIIAAVRGQVTHALRSTADRTAMWNMSVGVVLGPFLGVWLSLVSVTHAPAGIAATLMATVPVMMLPLSRIAYGDRPGIGSVAGTFLAVLGVAALFLAGGG